MSDDYTKPSQVRITHSRLAKLKRFQLQIKGVHGNFAVVNSYYQGQSPVK